MIIVTDGKRNPRVAREESQPGVLNRICVLKLVDQKMLEAAAIMFEKLGVVTQDFVSAQQQLRKVDQATTLTNFFVRLIKRNQLAPIRIAVIIDMLWAQTLVLLPVDEPLNFLWYPAAVVNVEALEESLDQPLNSQTLTLSRKKSNRLLKVLDIRLDLPPKPGYYRAGCWVLSTLKRNYWI